MACALQARLRGEATYNIRAGKSCWNVRQAVDVLALLIAAWAGSSLRESLWYQDELGGESLLLVLCKPSLWVESFSLDSL